MRKFSHRHGKEVEAAFWHDSTQYLNCGKRWQGTSKLIIVSVSQLCDSIGHALGVLKASRSK
jgi:hypothetical protein